MLGAICRMNQGVVVGLGSARLKKVFDRLVQLILESSDWSAIAFDTAEITLQFPGHLLFIIRKTRHAVEGYLRIHTSAKICALMTRRRIVAQNLAPRGIANG